MALLPLRKAVELDVERFGFEQHCAGMAREGLAGRGETHAARLALEQPASRLLFDGLDALADGRQGQVAPVGGTREVALLGHCNEQAQIGQAELHASSPFMRTVVSLPS